MAISATSIFVVSTSVVLVFLIFISTYAALLEDDVERSNYLNVFYVGLGIFFTLVSTTMVTYYVTNPLPTISQARALYTGAPVYTGTYGYSGTSGYTSTPGYSGISGTPGYAQPSAPPMYRQNVR